MVYADTESLNKLNSFKTSEKKKLWKLILFNSLLTYLLKQVTRKIRKTVISRAVEIKFIPFLNRSKQKELVVCFQTSLSWILHYRFLKCRQVARIFFVRGSLNSDGALTIFLLILPAHPWEVQSHIATNLLNTTTFNLFAINVFKLDIGT